MKRYTIYCTKWQTKKAIELGAPIEFKTLCHYELKEGKFTPYPDLEIDIDGEPVLIPPTAEQMVGWLYDKGITCFVRKQIYSDFVATVCVNDDLIYSHSCCSYKYATLDAINAALIYLSKNKK